MPRFPWKPTAFAAGCAALPPAVFHAALAAAAGTLFEAAPFVLFAELAASGRLRKLGLLASLAGCGCGESLPGALSLPATALCWLAFGPWVALGRFGAGVVVARCFPRVRLTGAHGAGHVETAAPGSDAFAELAALGVAALCGSVAVQGLNSIAPALHTALPATAAGAVGSATAAGAAGLAISFVAGAAGLAISFVAGAAGLAISFVAGALLGAVLPCATAGIAVAAGFAGTLPGAAAGLLASAGFARLRGSPSRSRRQTPAAASPPPAKSRNAAAEHGDDTRFASLALAAALIALVLRGPSGLVNPRLLPFAGAAALVALSRVRQRRSTLPGGGAFVPLAMLAALAAGSPPPTYRLDAAASPADAFPGAALTFTGVALRAGAGTIVERFAISCCRIDATPVAVRLDRRLPVPDGEWLTVSGTFLRGPGGALLLTPAAWHRELVPRDPFLYR